MREVRVQLPRAQAEDVWRQLNDQGLDTWLPPTDEGYILIQIQSVLDAWRCIYHRRVRMPLWHLSRWASKGGSPR